MLYGFEEQGHSGYGDAGNDVLCAALSAMTMLLINTVEVAYASSVTYEIDEKTTDITVTALSALPSQERDEKKQYAVSGLIYSYYLQLSDMLEDYYDFLDVDIEEREP